MHVNDLTECIIGSAIEVHAALGPGLLESAYETCLCRELELRSIPFDRQAALPVRYKGVLLDAGYRMDIVVDQQVIVEIKAVEVLLPIHKAQLLSYLRLADKRVGLLINFNVPLLKQGLQRMVNQLPETSAPSVSPR